MDHVVIFWLKLRATLGQQQLDEAVQELDVVLCRLQREGIDAWAILADPVYLAPVELDDALV